MCVEDLLELIAYSAWPFIPTNVRESSTMRPQPRQRHGTDRDALCLLVSSNCQAFIMDNSFIRSIFVYPFNTSVCISIGSTEACHI